MDNDSVVEQIVNSLSFEVEAVPQDNVLQLTTTTKAAPLNVKIRVRTKEKAAFRNGVISLPNKPNQPDNVPERFRLVSSDHTIMSFSVVMEADFQKPAKKSHGILGMFKPISCLGSQPDDEDYIYSPSTTYQAKVNNGNSQSDGALTKFTLMKNVDFDGKSATRKTKHFLGRCKPGGCLDPPFDEDGLPYSPAIVNEQPTAETVTKSKRRSSSVFSNKIFHKKKKSYDDETLDSNVIPKVPKDSSVVDLYQSDLQKPYSTNSIMTYPPTLNSSEHRETKRGSRMRTDSSKNSINEHSGSYFMIPKKQKYTLDKNVTINKESDEKIQDLKLSETLNKKPEESDTSIIKNLVIEQHLTKVSDSNTVTELTPLKNPVSDSSDNVVPIPIPITSQIEKVEMNKRRKESQEKKDSVINRRNSKSIDFLKQRKTSKGKPDSFLQFDNIVSNNNVIKDQISTAEQIVFENRRELANKSVVTIEAKHELSDMDLINPILKNERKSSSKTFTGTPRPIKDKPSESLNHEYENLQHLWQNQNDSAISDITFKKEDELVSETVTKNETINEVDGKENLKPILSNLDNKIKGLIGKENDNIKPDEIVLTKNSNSTNKDYTPVEIIKQNGNVIDSTIYKNNSVDEQGISNITQLKAADQVNKDILGLIRQDREFELATEPSPRRISSSNPHIKSEQISIIDTDEIQKPITFENDEIIKNDLPKFDNETFVVFKGEESVIKSKTSSKTNSGTDLLLSAEDNAEFNQYEKGNINSFLFDDLTDDRNLTKQDDSENLKQDRSKYISEDKSIHEMNSQATSERNSYITDRIKSMKDEESSDYFNINDKNENETELLKYYEVSSAADAVSYVVDNKLDNNTEKNSKNYLLLYAPKDNKEYNEYFTKNNNIYQLTNDFTEEKSETNQYVKESGEEDQPKYNTEDKPEFEHAEQANSERNSYSYISGDQIKPTEDKELTEYINEPYYENESKTELFKLDEISDVQDITNLTRQSKLDQREGEINHNLLNEIAESQIESIKTYYEANNEPGELYAPDIMQDSTLKDSAFHESTKKAQSLSLVDASEISKLTDQNQINSVEHLNFDHEIKIDSKTTTNPEHAGFENDLSDKYIFSKPFETKPRNIFVDLAVQKYVDDKNQTIVKSLDTDNVPKRYPEDSITVTKRYLNTDEEIQIPIDTDNNLYIQVKSNKLKDTIDETNNKNTKDKGLKEKLSLSKHKPYLHELDPVKRNGIIAEDIRKQLEVVYEKELLPLRSNISELNENIKMLTAHMLVTGRMFVANKSRSTKLIPIFKNCSCTRR